MKILIAPALLIGLAWPSMTEGSSRWNVSVGVGVSGGSDSYRHRDYSHRGYYGHSGSRFESHVRYEQRSYHPPVVVRSDFGHRGVVCDPPVVYRPPRVIYAPPAVCPPPVVYAPPVYYAPPPVVYAPPPVVYLPPPVVYQPGPNIYNPRPVCYPGGSYYQSSATYYRR